MGILIYLLWIKMTVLVYWAIRYILSPPSDFSTIFLRGLFFCGRDRHPPSPPYLVGNFFFFFLLLPNFVLIYNLNKGVRGGGGRIFIYYPLSLLGALIPHKTHIFGQDILNGVFIVFHFITYGRQFRYSSPFSTIW